MMHRPTKSTNEVIDFIPYIINPVIVRYSQGPGFTKKYISGAGATLQQAY
jgi:hypothetical protein